MMASAAPGAARHPVPAPPGLASFGPLGAPPAPPSKLPIGAHVKHDSVDTILQSPDSSVTLADEGFYAAPPMGFPPLPMVLPVTLPAAAVVPAYDGRDVLHSFRPPAEQFPMPGPADDDPAARFEQRPSTPVQNTVAAGVAGARRSPAPHVLGTSADSSSTTGGSGGIGSSIWSYGPRDGTFTSPKLGWSTVDADRSASRNETAPNGRFSTQDMRPEDAIAATPNLDPSSIPDFDGEINRSFETLALDDSASVASGYAAMQASSSPYLGERGPVSGYSTPTRQHRASFSGVGPARNLLATPPTKNAYPGSADSSPMTVMSGGSSYLLPPTTPPVNLRRSSLGQPVFSPDTSAGSPTVRPAGLGISMQPRPASATPYYVEQPFRPAGSPYLGSGDFSSWSAADPFQQAQPRYPAAPPRFDPHADQSPTRSLWIGNLDPHVDASTLAAAFRGFGPIESTRVLRERDCAFVNFLDPAHAVAARNAMQGRAIGGMPVRIGFGRVERGEREGAGEQVPTKSVWIGNLPGGVEAEDLRRIFRQFGPMESARVLTHKNCGFVNFENIEHAMEAVRAMHGTQIGPNFVRLGYAKVPAREGFPRPLADAGYGYPAAGTWQDEQAYRDDAAFEGPEPAPFPAAPGGEDYMSAIPELPDPAPHRRPDQARLREMRKKLEGQGHAGVGLRELDAMFAECEDDFVGLSTDYIGNVVLQKILERVGDHYRQRFINQVAPYLAAIGVHKNGTWLAQKLIQLSRTPQHMDTIVASIRPYTYRLLQDQVGNYVVQQCLSFTDGRNQFVFDAMSGPRCREIATDRYGARCMRTCLELPQTSQLQQRQVAAAIIRNGRQLAVNPNGVLLVTWLLETSQLHGRYRLLAQQFEEEMAGLACDKLASTIIVKLVNQRVELDARRIVFDALFFNDGWRSGIQHVLNDFAHGVALLQKFLSSTYLDHEEKTRVADRIRMGLAAAAADVARNANAGYRRLIDELRMLPVGPDGVQAVATLGRFGVDAGIGAFPGYHAIDQMAAQGEAPVVLASAGPSFRDAPAMPDFAPFQMQPPAQDLQAGWNGMPAYPPARGQYNQSADPDALQL